MWQDLKKNRDKVKNSNCDSCNSDSSDSSSSDSSHILVKTTWHLDNQWDVLGAAVRDSSDVL